MGKYEKENDTIKKPFLYNWLTAEQMRKIADFIGKISKRPPRKRKSYDKIKFYW